MSPSISFLLYFWVGFLCIGTLKFSSYVGGTNVTCLEKERQALLNFKQGLKDPSTRISSWSGDDCCRWKGIRCNNKTGHVIKLNLRNSYQEKFSPRKYIQFNQQTNQPDMKDDFEAEFNRSCISGEINPSLLELKYLMHLDLSFNCFGGIGIPKFFGSFNKLTYLNLSGSGFGGRVPHELGNLSTLCYLDLNDEAWLEGYASVTGDYDSRLPSYGLHVDSLHWLSHLSSLQHLNMRSLNLSMAADWLLSINMLPSIRNLQLPNCNLPNISTSLQHVNLSSLLTLDLSDNMLGPGLPTWLFNISRLMSLNLDYTYLRDPLPTALGNLCNLQTLSLQDNFISGEINKFKGFFKGCISSSLVDLNLESNQISGYLPHWLGRFTNLKSLSLFGNSLSGSISPSLGRLSSLTELSLGDNYLSGSIPPSLGRLSSLRALDLDLNSLSGSIPPSLGRLSSLRILSLSDNHLNGSIPRSIGQLSNLEYIYVHNNSFHCIMSEAHFSNLTKLKMLSTYSTSLLLNVSSSWIPPFQLTHIMMDDCQLGPQFPPWIRTQKELVYLSLSNVSISDAIPDFFWNISSTIYYIDLSSNSISGTLPKNIGEKTSNLMHLSLSSNRLMGSIPMSICKMKFLTNLDLSNNHLMDEIPPCLGDLQFLNALNVENNSLSGHIPNSISYLSSLKSLHLSKNKLTGEFPASLRNCTRLITLDLGENRFVGKIPKWIGENLTSLRFLILRSNMFDGNLPSQLSLLSELRVLDLSQNNFSGTIPASFGNFSAMSIVQIGNGHVNVDDVFGGSESIRVSWKGSQYEYSNTVLLVLNINLSGNDLHGEIPTEITQLRGLQSLNLSKNHLTGTIPKEINDLRWIESIDLSWNQLSGELMILHLASTG
ncbi:leucine-rich repeat receptor protein kinase MSP1-like protein [Cinnamomum micranthum f. kanehirae]|uniref:Leucine-rich repeat receptor protein kinase MSP1-like protein n=1 Tax=Cinnamomum micranthum f. kanehirae TaxID=337451 RepID=A0A3S3NFY7_9MAGN|nr:leucine-rich repeat receptor protein kinase MSP1-like protein [Cinnamomum micranthum f. kanehirae]